MESSHYFKATQLASASSIKTIKTTSLMFTKEEAERELQRVFGYDGFRKGQWEIIQSCLEGKDVMAVMPTGGGKSICYQMMTVLRKQPIVVISPLISLMEDQKRELSLLKGIGVGCVHSMQSMEESRKVFQDCQKAVQNQEPFVLYLSPEKLVSLSEEMDMRPFAMVAIDEAHCVSQWGHDFRPEYTQIGKICQNNVMMAMTASATPMVLTDIIRHLKMKEPKKWVFDVYRPNLYYQVEICSKKEQKLAWTRQAIQQTPSGRILVYTGTRKDCEIVVNSLKHEFNNEIQYYHAGLSTQERKRIQDEYDRGEIRILVATNAFGMGINHPDVRLVVHYAIPSNIDSLYQEMGRAGRDNEKSTCLLLYSSADRGLRCHFIHQAPEHQKKMNWYRLNALVEYAESKECRHAFILQYYHQKRGEFRCEHCDRCTPSSSRRVLSKICKNISSPTSCTSLTLLLLKEWRKQEADKIQKPVYCVLTNKTLEEMVSKNPSTLPELLEIHGMGPKKVSEYGNELLQLLRRL